MIDGESRSILIAVLAGAAGAPLVGYFLSRKFPPDAGRGDIAEMRKHRTRNRVIEACGVLFFMIGISLPFLWTGQASLDPTMSNFALIMCCGLICGIAGIRLLTLFVGDRGATCFLTYYEAEHKINARSVSLIARILFGSSVATVVAVLTFRLMV